MMSEPTHELRLLADPTRARIVSLIRDRPQARQLVGALSTQLGLRQPTVSHHVKALRDAGLLEREPQGRTVWYSIAPDQTDRVAELLSRPSEMSVSRALLGRISGDLTTRFSGIFAPEAVGLYVRESYALLSDQTHITRCLPLLTDRFTADRSAAHAAAQCLTVRTAGSVPARCSRSSVPPSTRSGCRSAGNIPSHSPTACPRA